MLELELHRWLAEKQRQQSLAAVFYDAWFTCFSGVCQTTKVDLDVREYERRYTVPTYVLSYYRREASTTH